MSGIDYDSEEEMMDEVIDTEKLAEDRHRSVQKPDSQKVAAFVEGMQMATSITAVILTY